MRRHDRSEWAQGRSNPAIDPEDGVQPGPSAAPAPYSGTTQIVSLLQKPQVVSLVLTVLAVWFFVSYGGWAWLWPQSGFGSQVATSPQSLSTGWLLLNPRRFAWTNAVQTKLMSQPQADLYPTAGSSLQGQDSVDGPKDGSALTAEQKEAVLGIKKDGGDSEQASDESGMADSDGTSQDDSGDAAQKEPLAELALDPDKAIPADPALAADATPVEGTADAAEADDGGSGSGVAVSALEAGGAAAQNEAADREEAEAAQEDSDGGDAATETVDTEFATSGKTAGLAVAAATTGGGGGAAVCDNDMHPPTTRTWTCEQQREWGKCDEEFMRDEEGVFVYCAKTCGRPCPAVAATAAGQVAEEPAAVCPYDLELPDNEHTCEQQREWGKCEAEYMMNAEGALVYCAKTCGRPCSLIKATAGGAADAQEAQASESDGTLQGSLDAGSAAADALAASEDGVELEPGAALVSGAQQAVDVADSSAGPAPDAGEAGAAVAAADDQLAAGVQAATDAAAEGASQELASAAVLPGAAVAGAGSAAVCEEDVPVPKDPFGCEQQRDWAKCSAEFMQDNGMLVYCAKTCGRPCVMPAPAASAEDMDAAQATTALDIL